jgi:hypothetical protein
VMVCSKQSTSDYALAMFMKRQMMLMDAEKPPTPEKCNRVLRCKCNGYQ